MPGCAVAGCKNYSKSTKGSNIRYFRFPRDKQMCKEWIIACRRDSQDKINIKNACICSLHFEKDCFADLTPKEKLLNYRMKTKRALKLHAVPTLNIPENKNEVNRDRSSCMTDLRKNSVAVSSCAMVNLDISMTNNNFDVPTENHLTARSDIEKTDEQKEIFELKEKVKILKQQNTKLQEKISSLEERIKHNI